MNAGWHKFAELLAAGCDIRVDRTAPPGHVYAIDSPAEYGLPASRALVFHSEAERDVFMAKLGAHSEARDA